MQTKSPPPAASGPPTGQNTPQIAPAAPQGDGTPQPVAEQRPAAEHAQGPAPAASAKTPGPGNLTIRAPGDLRDQIKALACGGLSDAYVVRRALRVGLREIARNRLLLIDEG